MFVRFDGHENVPHSPQLQGLSLSKDSEGSTPSITKFVLKATFSTSCSQLMAEHRRNTKAGKVLEDQGLL